MRRTTQALAALLISTELGCVHPSVVERAYGGDVVAGHYVSPEAYAAFLRGAIAQAENHPEEALKAYTEAAERDPASPEPWTRMAEVWCSPAEGGAAKADQALAHALALDAGYAPAWAVKAACAAARSDAVGEEAAAARAAQLDPQGDGANILLARAAGNAGPEAARSRALLVALTVTASDPVAAWSALASWAEAHGDVALWTRALVELARTAPERRSAIASASEELAGAGDVGEARTVAAAALEASESPLPARLALAARLAVDEAITRHDPVGVRRRATRGRLALDEVAGRALLAGDRALARDVASTAAAASPGDLGARLAIAVADGSDLLGAAASARAGDTPVSGAALVAFGLALMHAASPLQARAALAAAPRVPLLAGDDRVIRAAVELVSRGVLPAEVLPPDGVVEAFVVMGVSGSALSVAPDDPGLDRRHRYLALALTLPNSPQIRELSARLRAASPMDPVVAAASAIAQLAEGGPIAPDAPRALLARDPADPLLAAVALRLAEKTGDAEVARRARETLSALGASRRRVE
jgi:tetratricopeptide (TPR) repeat protein